MKTTLLIQRLLMLTIGILIVTCSLSVYAAPALENLETWDTGLQGWSRDTGYDSAVAWDSSDTKFVELTFDAIGSPPPIGKDYDIIRTDSAPATDDFEGDYSSMPTDLGWQFDLIAPDGAPADIEFRFASGGRTWSFNLADPTTSWTKYRVPFAYSASWTAGPGPGEAQFDADLASVDWIGIYIKRDGLAEQTYGLDNFMLYVPEPAEIILLITAFAGLWQLRRKQRLTGEATA